MFNTKNWSVTEETDPIICSTAQNIAHTLGMKGEVASYTVTRGDNTGAIVVSYDARAWQYATICVVVDDDWKAVLNDDDIDCNGLPTGAITFLTTAFVKNRLTNDLNLDDSFHVCFGNVSCVDAPESLGLLPNTKFVMIDAFHMEASNEIEDNYECAERVWGYISKYSDRLRTNSYDVIVKESENVSISAENDSRIHADVERVIRINVTLDDNNHWSTHKISATVPINSKGDIAASIGGNLSFFNANGYCVLEDTESSTELALTIYRDLTYYHKQ